MRERLDVLQDDQANPVQRRWVIGGPERVPDVVLFMEALGHQLERQLVDPGRQVGICVALERPVGLQVLDDLGEVLPRDVVLLESRDEQDVEDIASAVCKVLTNISQLVASGEQLAGVKSLSRADRPRIEKTRNY